MLFPILQRYKFETNSQLSMPLAVLIARCFQYFKDTNLRPIHNSLSSLHEIKHVVSNTSKIQIWDQFTTVALCRGQSSRLFPILQRYKFETNSQLLSYIFLLYPSCFQYFKDTNLRPIHNILMKIKKVFKVVSNTSKIQIWDQFTTYGRLRKKWFSLFPILQRYKFETNSQQCLPLFALN